MEDIQERIYELIKLNCPIENLDLQLTSSTRLLEDLEYDSVALMSLLVDVEEEFDIEINDMEGCLQAFENVGIFFSYIINLIEVSDA